MRGLSPITSAIPSLGGPTFAIMPTITDQAIVIRRWDFSETSQTVSLFTRDHGIVRGLAKGAKREKGDFSGGLDLLTREYLLIASCTTLGHAVPQLKAHIDAALKLGAARQQIIEVILQMTFYAGGAAVSNALAHAKEVFKNHQA